MQVPAENAPAPDAVQLVMLPVGVPKDPDTVAVHVLAVFTATGFGVQLTAVLDAFATTTEADSWKCPAFA